MTELVTLVRRHEETRKDTDGKKLDSPTPQGLANAYQRGIELRQQYPDAQIRASYSEADRTYYSANAWMMGASGDLEGMTCTPGLNPLELSADQKARVRNSSKEEKMQTIYGEFLPQLATAGERIASYVIEQIMAHLSSGDSKTTVNVDLSHSPTMDAAYLILTGQELILENNPGFDEGKGFDVRLYEKDGVHYVEITAEGQTKKYVLYDVPIKAKKSPKKTNKETKKSGKKQ